MNAVILIAVLSVGNSSIYASSRTLAALDPSADAARIASWCPYRGYAATRLWAFGR